TSGTSGFLCGVASWTPTPGPWWVVPSRPLQESFCAPPTVGLPGTPQSSGTRSFLRGGAFVGANTGTAVGDFGTILHTITGGGPATWTLQASGTSSHLRGLSFGDASTGTAVGDSGTILRTTDGATWTPQSSGTGNPLTGVSFVDANTGWSVGFLGRF